MPADESRAARARTEVRITVVRTGGFAGLARRWSIAPPPQEEPVWADRIEACPWGHTAPAPPSGADRFCWEVAAVRGGEEHHAELADQDVDGPWRALIDAVRSAADGSGAAAPEQ